jgi:hypothetical protein
MSRQGSAQVASSYNDIQNMSISDKPAPRRY